MQNAYRLLEQMPPLKNRKDEKLAAIAGFALGAVGLGLFFGTLADFLVPFFIWAFLWIAAAPTLGTSLIAGPVLCAVIGYKRAQFSNAKLQGRTAEILEAEIVSEPPLRTTILLQSSLQTRLQRLDGLLTDGILSPSEHAEKRAQLLREI